MSLTDEAIDVAREHIEHWRRQRLSVPDLLALIDYRGPRPDGGDDLLRIIAWAWLGVAYAGLSPREADQAETQLELWRRAA